MNYDEFKAFAQKELQKHMPLQYADYRQQESQILKINQTLDAVCFVPKQQEADETLAVPTLYYNDFYPLIEKGKPPEEVLSLMAKIIADSEAPQGIREKISARLPRIEDVVPQVIHYEKNRKFLEDVPHRKILDLAVIYRAVMFTDDGQIYGSVINDAMRTRFNVTEEELFETALRQVKQKMPYRIYPVYRELYAYTNEPLFLGAASILEKGGMRDLARKFKDDLYVLPASIHEVMLLPYSRFRDEQVLDMLRLSNKEAIMPEEWLSDRIYRYRRRTDEITFVSMES